MIDTATKYKQSSDLRGWPRGAESATLKGGALAAVAGAQWAGLSAWERRVTQGRQADPQEAQQPSCGTA